MSVSSHQQSLAGRLRTQLDRFGPALLIAVLVAWHAFHNWLWLSNNVVLTGWDKARHLAQSLTYNNLLTPLTLRTFFGALISDSVRPPFAPMAAVPLYRLFGTSSDVATMLNVLYLAVTLVATYKIGVLLRSRSLGILSTLLLALFPMFYAMSRYFYLEFPLTALVALTMWLLLGSAGFQKRGFSLLFGLCLGLGLLTKRTYVAFVMAPVAFVVLTSDVFPSLWRRIRGGVRIDLKHAALALAGGLALAAAWFLPNWAAIQGRALGGWIFPLWAGLVAITIYLLLRRPAPDVNFLSALTLGVVIGSTWYLANTGFMQRMLLFAYGVNDPRGRTIQIGSLHTYTEFLVTLVNQHISLIVVLLLIVAALVLLIALLRRKTTLSVLRRVRSGWWAVLLWLVGPYAVLTLSIYHETRAITPVLPAIALLAAGLILKIPWRSVRSVLIALLVVIGIVQFYAVSFEPLHGLVDASSLRLPFLGDTGLLGRGGYLQVPDAAATDSGYWIEPDVLERMEGERLAQGWESASLGLLVNAKQINFEHFAYLTLAGDYYPQITVERLARAHGPEPVYPRLFQHDYLLVKQENAAADADSQAVIDQILEEPTTYFQQAFALDASYPLPDGDTVYLYHRRVRPPEGAAADFAPELAQTLNAMATEDSVLIVIPPDLVPLLGQNLDRELDLYAFSGRDTTGETITEAVAGHESVLLVLGELEGSQLDTGAQRWLDERGYRAWDGWFGPTQLVLYGLSSGADQAEIQLVNASLGDTIALRGYSVWDQHTATGGLLYLTLMWETSQSVGQNYKVFVHLLDGDGQLVSQRDSEPQNGLRPTATWQPGETVSDRVGLWLPASLSPGQYQLLMGMYDPETLERLPVYDASGQEAGDTISLGSITIPASE
jgi:4-amino-4-deoxy-L-arabinose transferase-like glycosyltransferase